MSQKGLLLVKWFFLE